MFRTTLAVLLLLTGCTDEVAEIDPVGARYTEAGELELQVVQKDADGDPVAVAGTFTATVVEGDRTVCSTTLELPESAVDEGSAFQQVSGAVECEPPAEDARHEVRVTFEAGGRSLSASIPLRYEGAPEPAIAPAPEPTPPVGETAAAPTDSKPEVAPNAGAPRASAWPCEATERSTLAESQPRWEWEYGGPAECTVPLEFQVIGCPTVERLHSGGDGTFDYERTFRYAADGRLAEVEERNHGQVERSWELYYDESGQLTRIVDHGRRGDSTLRPERDGDTVRFGTRTFHLEGGRVTSIDLPASTERWEYRGPRLLRIVSSNQSGAEVWTKTFDYGC